MLEVREVTVAFDGQVAVDAVDLTVPDGGVVAVLGPSGCGKSTLLRAVAGVEHPTSGTVAWDGTDLTRVPTHRRGFALMFQDGQLFDHLTVARNIAYAPRLRRTPRAATAEQVADLLALVGLEGYADRLPRTLSGGERQRVALARSLAARPRLLLLDEPLSALDAELRIRLAADLRRILTEAGTTGLMVTHDQDEAFAVADRIALMRSGRIVQHGPTAEVWAAPVDAWAARFLGCAEVLEGEAAARILVAAGQPGAEGAAVGVRPRGLRVVSADGPITGLPGRVVSVRLAPGGQQVSVDVPGVGVLEALGGAGWIGAPGDAVSVAVDPVALARVGRR